MAGPSAGGSHGVAQSRCQTSLFSMLLRGGASPSPVQDMPLPPIDEALYHVWAFNHRFPIHVALLAAWAVVNTSLMHVELEARLPGLPLGAIVPLLLICLRGMAHRFTSQTLAHQVGINIAALFLTGVPLAYILSCSNADLKDPFMSTFSSKGSAQAKTRWIQSGHWMIWSRFVAPAEPMSVTRIPVAFVGGMYASLNLLHSFMMYAFMISPEMHLCAMAASGSMVGLFTSTRWLSKWMSMQMITWMINHVLDHYHRQHYQKINLDNRLQQSSPKLPTMPSSSVSNEGAALIASGASGSHPLLHSPFTPHTHAPLSPHSHSPFSTAASPGSISPISSAASSKAPLAVDAPAPLPGQLTLHPVALKPHALGNLPALSSVQKAAELALPTESKTEDVVATWSRRQRSHLVLTIIRMLTLVLMQDSVMAMISPMVVASVRLAVGRMSDQKRALMIYQIVYVLESWTFVIYPWTRFSRGLYWQSELHLASTRTAHSARYRTARCPDATPLASHIWVGSSSALAALRSIAHARS